MFTEVSAKLRHYKGPKHRRRSAEVRSLTETRSRVYPTGSMSHFLFLMFDLVYGTFVSILIGRLRILYFE